MAEENKLKNEESTIQEEPMSQDEVVEPIFAEGEQSEIPEEKDELQLANEKIAELEGKLEEAENRFLRHQADLDNFRRRARLDMEASQKYRAQNIITDLLPALDNFERALNVETDNEQVKSVLQGVEMVYRGLLEAIKKEGAEPIEAVGKEFDPHLHQAIMQVEDENFASNIVVEEFQKGYILKDRVIRPSMVKVNQ